MKNATKIDIYLSRVSGKTYIAFDANVSELKEFGISEDDFKRITDYIETFINLIIKGNMPIKLRDD